MTDTLKERLSISISPDITLAMDLHRSRVLSETGRLLARSQVIEQSLRKYLTEE